MLCSLWNLSDILYLLLHSHRREECGFFYFSIMIQQNVKAKNRNVHRKRNNICDKGFCFLVSRKQLYSVFLRDE